jgi:hypothetical protein
MPFAPGQSGNPNGRPKRDKFLTQQLIAELRLIDPKTQVNRTRRVIQALIDKAEEGDVAAIREVLDRVEGKVTQIIGGDEESPLDLLGGLGAAIDSKLDRLIAGRIAAAKVEPDR